MTYTKPEVRLFGSALAVVQLQSVSNKGGSFTDRADLQHIGPHSTESTPAAYEADE